MSSQIQTDTDAIESSESQLMVVAYLFGIVFGLVVAVFVGWPWGVVAYVPAMIGGTLAAAWVLLRALDRSEVGE